MLVEIFKAVFREVFKAGRMSIFSFGIIIWLLFYTEVRITEVEAFELWRWFLAFFDLFLPAM